MGSESNLIKDSFDRDFHIIPHDQSFIIPNGMNHSGQSSIFQIADVEMVPLQALTYTSLRDLLPASPPDSILWPTYKVRKDSWREIAIKDPLLQHAAWAYLQPMTTEREADDRSLFLKLVDGCGGLFGCFGGFLNDVVWRSMRGLLFNENVADGHGPRKVDRLRE